jgi:hypothetical protein
MAEWRVQLTSGHELKFVGAQSILDAHRAQEADGTVWVAHSTTKSVADLSMLKGSDRSVDSSFTFEQEDVGGTISAIIVDVP